MIRGTTPDYILQIQNIDLTGKTVYATFAQGSFKITKSNDEVVISTTTTEEGVVSEIAITLSQEETLKLREGTAEVQVKWIDADGHVEGTEIANVPVSKALLDKVIQYANSTP